MNIESLLREDLADRAGGVQTPEDPWPSFARREVRHRRVRRARVGAAVLGLTGLLSVQTGLVPTPGWAPAIAVASNNDDLVKSPVRGSLAGDTAWLEAMKGQVEDIKEDEGVWKVERSKVRFLYASDVGALRLALAYVPMRLGMFSSPQLVWFYGTAGAPPSAMEQRDNGDASKNADNMVLGAPDGTNIAVVIGPVGSTAAISPGYEFTAAGRVEPAEPETGTPGAGYVERVLPASMPMFTMTGSVTFRGEVKTMDFGGSFNGPENIDNLDLNKAIGDKPISPQILHSWLDTATEFAGLTYSDLRIEVRWAGTVNGRPAGVFTLQKPGQGVLAYAFHGDKFSSTYDLGMLLPAAGAEDRVLAWRMMAEADGDEKTNRVLLVAPESAARVELAVEGRPPVPVTLDGTGFGETVLDPQEKATVVAYRADGSRLSSTAVVPFSYHGFAVTEALPPHRVAWVD